jgi:hypothetical protein
MSFHQGSQSEFRATGVTHPSVDESSIVNEARKP